MNYEDLSKEQEKGAWNTKLQEIFPDGEKTKRKSLLHHLQEHNYRCSQTHQVVVEYMAGYVAATRKRLTKCQDCRIKLLATEDSVKSDYKLITALSHGGLSYPSIDLVKLVSILESKVLLVVEQLGLHQDSIFQILDEISTIENLPAIGCEKHRQELSLQVIHFYIPCRGHFLCDKYNSNHNEKNKKTQMNRKDSKLTDSAAEKQLENLLKNSNPSPSIAFPNIEIPFEFISEYSQDFASTVS